MLSQQKPIRVLVVDDSLVARNMITKGLESYPRIQVVGTAINAVDAKTKIAQLTPDVVTMDVEMPGMNGIDFLKSFLPQHPIPVILVSSLNLRVFDALAVGAVDFVRKPDGTESISSFLRSLYSKILVPKSARKHSADPLRLLRRPLLRWPAAAFLPMCWTM